MRKRLGKKEGDRLPGKGARDSSPCGCRSPIAETLTGPVWAEPEDTGGSVPPRHAQGQGRAQPPALEGSRTEILCNS